MTLKLSKIDRVRLAEIAAGKFTNCAIMPETTARLIENSLATAKGGRIAKSGRIIWHADAVITDPGRAALAEAGRGQ